MSLFSATKKPSWKSARLVQDQIIASTKGWVYTNPHTHSDEILATFSELVYRQAPPQPTSVAFVTTSAPAGSNKTIEVNVFFDGPIAVSGSPTMNLVGNEGGVATHGAITGGSGYSNGTYNAVPLTGGNGTGAQATIVVSGATVTTVTITAAGDNYLVGDVLSASGATLTTQGQVATVGNIAGTATGSGSSTNVATTATSGVGTGLTVNVTRVAPNYTAVTVGNNAGSGYAVNDNIKVLGTALGGATPTNDLTFSISTLVPNGSGFSTPVATVSGASDTLTYVGADSDLAHGKMAFKSTTITVGTGETFTVGGATGGSITGTVTDKADSDNSVGSAATLSAVVTAGHKYGTIATAVPTRNRTGVGSGLTVNLTFSGDTVATVAINAAGDGYAVGDTVMVDDPRGRVTDNSPSDIATFTIATISTLAAIKDLTPLTAATLTAS